MAVLKIKWHSLAVHLHIVRQQKVRPNLLKASQGATKSKIFKLILKNGSHVCQGSLAIEIISNKQFFKNKL